MGPLVSTAWLEARLDEPRVRIADCRFYLAEPSRGEHEYRSGHIPGARYFSLDRDLTATTGPGRHPLPEAARFAESLREAGVGKSDSVIVYDQGDSSMAARMWWMLRSLGHRKAFVLDGGWAAWTDERRTSSVDPPAWEPAKTVVGSTWSGIIDREAIASGRDHLCLIDSRAAARHRGEVEPIDPVAGHIPGSINIPYQENTDATGRFLTAAALRERFAGVPVSDPTVCYCGSGVTACSNILAMEVAGHTGVLLYPGSWSDWCTSGGEVAP
jgi:thiosulfate/3-mercaptopyruvate sulfurtransferase